ANAPGSTFKRSAGNGTVNCIVQFNHNAGALPISTGKFQLTSGGTWTADATVIGDLIIADGLLTTQKVATDKLTVTGGTSMIGGLQVGDVSLNGGMLAPTAASKINGVLTMTGGRLGGAGDLSIGNASCTAGRLDGPGKLQIRSGSVVTMSTSSQII